MRGEFLYAKANFMIMVMMCAMFTVYLANPASAQEATQTAALGCCQEAKNTGESCVMTTQDECATPSDGFTPASCEQTTYCKTGCCVSLDGVCSTQVARGTCQSLEGYTWYDNAQCSLAQCQKGCCTLGEAQCFYTTEKKCKQVTSEYEALTLDFRTAVVTEYDCLNICKQQDQGCCVSEEKTCKFTTRGNCPSRDFDTGSGMGFFKDTFCSNDNLDCACESHDHQDCLEGSEKVYWFDSCGNREEIVTDTIEGSQNDARNGDCDYSTGTLCGYNEDGKAICKDLNCAKDKLTVYDNMEYIFQGQDRSNGESWCMYDAKPGVGSDPVGSRHYRFMCINGEEQVEPCADARQEICKNGIINDVPDTQSGNIIEAQCMANNPDACATECNSAGQLSDVSEDDLNDAMKKDAACCKKSAPNCYWMDWVDPKDKTFGKCYPVVAPGSKFWQGESTSIQKEPQCDLATSEYPTKWTETFAYRGDWKCTKGCEAYSQDYLTLFNNYCNSVGDCGAQYSYQGVWTGDGLYRTWDEASGGKPKDADDKEYDPVTTLEKDPSDSWNTKTDPPGRLNVAEGLVSYSMSYQFLVQQLKEMGVDTSSSLTGMKWTAGVSGGLVGLAAVLGYFTMAFGAISGAAISTGFAVGAGAIETILFQGSQASAAIAGLQGAGVSGTLGAATAAISWAASAAGVVMIIWGAAAGNEGLMKTGIYVAAGGAVGLATIAIVSCDVLCPTGYGAIVVAVIVAVAAAAMATARDETRMVTIQCAPWQAPTSGYDCKSCDSDPKKQCSEYRCKSIGQNCKFLQENEGTNRGTCYNSDPNDVNSPRVTGKSAKVISHGKDLSSSYQISPTETTSQVTGFKITPNVPPYSKVVLEITTNEMSQCKIGTELPQGAAPYGVLPNFMPDSYYDMSHNYTIAGVIPEKDYHYYIACQDSNGNAQATVYGVQFTVDKGNDITPPQIIAANFKDNAYVASGSNETLVAIYVDEQSPLECKWSKEDKDFNFMENNMSCAAAPMEATSDRTATCAAKLLLSSKQNKFYFRCKDEPAEYAGGLQTGNSLSPNVMQQSFPFNLQQTDPLVIQQTSPQGKLYTNNVTMQVKTQVGAESGKAVCYYNNLMFFKTNDSYHEQNLANLPTGNYKYDIECQDAAGNFAYGNITFSVDVDTSSPSITAISYSSNTLKIKTSEPSTCQYSNDSFMYGQGTQMPPDNSAEHSIAASMPRYAIICADKFGNRMPEVKIVLFSSIS